MKSKSSKQVTSYATGPHAPTAMNTAPPVVAERSIGGFGKLKEASGSPGASGAGTPSPGAKRATSGYNPPSDSPECKGTKSGGPSRAGPRGTQGGTSSPKHGPGPSGLGQAGTKFPPIG